MLERGEVANSWRHERWDSLRLLTPNWQSRLPGAEYNGTDPDGYMSMGEVIEFISRFAATFGAPVRTHTAVTSLRRTDAGYHVATSTGDLACRVVVLASGACNVPSVPSLRQAVPASIPSFTAFDYRNPSVLPEGGVLVVGASATGVQLADEIHRSGRRVTLAVGEHVRLPRSYRGRDVLWWMDASGVWGQRYDQIDDLTRARRLPSPQLVGTPERTTLDLNAVAAIGVELVGRLSAPCATAARCSPEACGISSRWRISRWIACWTRLTSGRAPTGSMRTRRLQSGSILPGFRRRRGSAST